MADTHTADSAPHGESPALPGDIVPIIAMRNVTSASRRQHRTAAAVRCCRREADVTLRMAMIGTMSPGKAGDSPCGAESAVCVSAMTLLLSSIFAGSYESDFKTAVQVTGVTEPETRS